MAIHIDTDGNFWFGQTGSQELSEISYTPVFSVTKTGVLTATSGTVGGWELANTYLRASDGTNYITLNNNGSISGNYSQNTAGWIIAADGSAEFNDVTVRGELKGVELSGTLDFNGGTFRTSGSTPRIEITDNSQREGEIRYETSLGTAMRLAVESTSPSDFFIENGILNGDTRIITSSGGIISLEGDTLNLSNGTSTNDPILTFNGINAASKTSTTLSKLLGVTSTGRLAVGSATSGVASLSVSGDLSLSGSSGVLNIHHTESDHSFNYDNYGSWKWQVNGGSFYNMLSGYGLNFRAGSNVGISITNTSPYEITISSSGGISSAVQGINGNTSSQHYFSTNGTGFFSSSDMDGSSSTHSFSFSSTMPNAASITTGHLLPNGTKNVGGFGVYWDYIYYNNLSGSSDERRKNSIENIDIGLDFINTLIPRKFKWNVDVTLECDTCTCTGGTLGSPCEMNGCEGTIIDSSADRADDIQYGFIAQETLPLLPDTDNLDYQLVKHDTEIDEYTMSYTSIIAPLVKAVQELSTQISELTARVEALEG